MEQFRIEVASEGQGYFFNVKPIGGHRYEIYKEEDKIGTIQLDGQDHEHCTTIDCKVDLPLLNAIREGILTHESSPL
ncbi:hypothetical protein [Pedobacter metabolipauper]|uniref:Uncharacterized protein n=1 Tax=Pedobacter metabolipauper TaxID=425513 RepID=A0A4R6ST77_9SPHI|nr:hypothetical protein [Pedobacter metabolipauper]TDQ06704.1 hypothetical protein ATK78_4363 [Pedobacter metabolipauper]